ncbi:DUF4249 domain-containing protein [Echinicola sp. 20G]|uniref:DUF4249 domain-containing protein n=1 Tax=Echinicola sp. 20G TaxID=2781961 RepID=UPI001910730D|nr:DUF4249 domain-containing protein [Echinicola sp. 20G]
MSLRQIILAALLTNWIMVSCREPYDPQIDQQDLGILVVEGHIETGEYPSIIKLSTTSTLNGESNGPSTISNAEVYIESQSGEIFSLPLTGEGVYSAEHNLSLNQDYRLHIELPDKGLYQSKWMTPINTPVIEDIGLTGGDYEDVEVNVSTHGNEEAEFFVWEYEETWIFFPEIISFLRYDENLDSIVYRINPEDRIDRCWKSEYSDKVNVESSSQYQDDYIFQKHIQTIPYGSEKFSQRYSILVYQRAIPKDAYDFYEILRKNSDDTGDIFSPLPSNIGTNVFHQSDENLKAIGFVTAGSSTRKRAFFDRIEVGTWLVDIPYYAGCEIYYDTIPPNEVGERFNNNIDVPAMIVDGGPTGILGYRGASRKCTDCRLRGTNVRPDFW